MLNRNISAKGARWPSGVICRNSLLKPHLNFTIYAETTFCVTHLSFELPSTPVRNTIRSISWFKPSTELRIDDLGIGFTGIVTGSTFRVGDRMYAVNCCSKNSLICQENLDNLRVSVWELLFKVFSLGDTRRLDNSPRIFGLKLNLSSQSDMHWIFLRSDQSLSSVCKNWIWAVPL